MILHDCITDAINESPDIAPDSNLCELIICASNMIYERGGLFSLKTSLPNINFQKGSNSPITIRRSYRKPHKAHPNFDPQRLWIAFALGDQDGNNSFRQVTGLEIPDILNVNLSSCEKPAPIPFGSNNNQWQYIAIENRAQLNAFFETVIPIS